MKLSAILGCHLMQHIMDRKQAEELLLRFRLGTASESEEALVRQWLMFGKFGELQITEGELESDLGAVAARLPLDYGKTVRKVRLWPRLIVAAALLAIVFGVSIWYARMDRPDAVAGLANDVAPGKNGATLTLGDGRKILIDDALAGNLVEEAGVQISKDAEGNLVYKVLENNNERLTYHTLATTRGEQVRVRLPDGTLVFLNAGSSLRYPSSFAKLSKREVVLTGEGYFEVSKDRLHPFSVKTAKQQLEVLGTHFNVESYEEDRTRTTLVEGSVRVTESNGLTKELKPGQQSVLSAKGIQVEEVEAEYAVAWKDGFFMFNNDSLREIMEQVGLWYDVQVVYLDPSLQQETFIGTINKFEQLSKVLAMLEKTKVATFRVEGKRIVISRR